MRGQISHGRAISVARRISFSGFNSPFVRALVAPGCAFWFKRKDRKGFAI